MQHCCIYISLRRSGLETSKTPKIKEFRLENYWQASPCKPHSNGYFCAMKKLVFIIEDDLVQQKMLQVHFEEILANYTARTFSNPEDMLPHLKEKPFAVVLDHFFSDEGGKTGLDYLRLMKKNYSNIPVIYYTTLEDDAVRAEVMSLGAEQYIIKNSASLVRLRAALDQLHERESKKGFFGKLFS